MTEAQLSNAMDAYGSTVYRLALTRMQNIADAEDVYQEVFLRLWKQAAEDWDGDRAKAWLIRTTLNRCADLHRFRLRRPVLSFAEIPDLAQPEDESRELLAKDGAELYRTLQQVDPTAAAEIHPNNKNRVVRALELYYAGITKTAQNAASRREDSPYEALYFVLHYRDRQVLYDRINARVDAMLAAGLVEEARQAYAACGPTARQAIGHKELLPYLEGSEPLETAVERLKQETRRYAKRQITWFKRRQGTVVLEPDTMDTERLIAAATAQTEDFLYGKDKGKRA